ncbi:MAG TPA: hypothetical protein VMS76_08240 [Planctomycetota bacterium]|nr:hypothetical protein [Planctomycetota bacterium]
MRTPGSYPATPARESRRRTADGPLPAEDRSPLERPRWGVEGARLGKGTRRGAGSTDGMKPAASLELLPIAPIALLPEGSPPIGAPRFDSPSRSALRGAPTSPRAAGASAGALNPERPRSNDSREVEGTLGGA